MIDQFHIDGDVAIVTGASGGIGRAIAQRFADDGVNIAINSRDEDRITAVADDIRASDRDGEVYAAACDVRNRERVFEFVGETIDRFGPIDILVNNAGVTFSCGFEDLSKNAWDTVIDVNLYGTFHFTQAVGEVMRENDGGYVVNLISSAALEGGAPYNSHYGAAKAGVRNLTESLASEWRPHDIRVNCIDPGLIATPGMQELLGVDHDELSPRETTDREVGLPEETADIAQFLCSRGASCLTGSMLRAGITMMNDQSTDSVGE